MAIVLPSWALRRWSEFQRLARATQILTARTPGMGASMLKTRGRLVKTSKNVRFYIIYPPPPLCFFGPF
jgi:hypothetical protein